MHSSNSAVTTTTAATTTTTHPITSKTPETAARADAAQLDELHQRVNAMLDQPLPKEGDAFALPVELALGQAATRQG